jgi:hypothetical protein
MGHDRVLCFNCEKYGHYANMCPLKKDSNNGQEDQPDNQLMDMLPPDPIHGSRKAVMASLDMKKVVTNVILTGNQINLKDPSSIPFSRADIKNAIKDLAQKIVEKKFKMH